MSPLLGTTTTTLRKKRMKMNSITPCSGREKISSGHSLTGAHHLTVQEKALLDAGRAGTCLTADPRLERVRCTVSRLRRDCSNLLKRSSPKALAETEADRERKNEEDEEEEETGRAMKTAMEEKKKRIAAKRQKVDKVSCGGPSNEEDGQRGGRENGESISKAKIEREDNGVEHIKREEEEEEGTTRNEEKEEEKETKRERLSETWVLNELLEEVVGAELVDLSPSEDDGPTLVVFITGRPILIYRAFSSLVSTSPSIPCHSDHLSPLSSAQEQRSSASSLPSSHPSSSSSPSSSSPLSWAHDRNASPTTSREASQSSSFSSSFPEAHPSFPFRFALVSHDIAHPLPSRPLSLSSRMQSSSRLSPPQHSSAVSSSEGSIRGDDSEIEKQHEEDEEEEEEALPSTCTGYVVPYMGIGGCGRGALIVPPVNTPQAVSASSLFSSGQKEQERSFSSGISSDKKRDEKGEEDAYFSSLPSPPILWITSERNQIFIHPHARKDIISMAPFHVESSTPQG